MKPNKQFITINTSQQLVESFLKNVIIEPRQVMHHWASVTNQTPAAKLGYIGQHLASLITGVPGTGTGARGDDLADHTEVKSCNKVDQTDKCKSCGARVMRMQQQCPICHSTNIKRKQDSKWLFSIRSENELLQYKALDRLLLIIFDYPKFGDNDFSTIRIRAFEIYPKESRMGVFSQLVDNHYHNIYLPKIQSSNKANPMNLHPDLFQFYMCNPIKVYECFIYNIDTKPQIVTTLFLSPSAERDENLQSILMPSTILYGKELRNVIKNANYTKEIAPMLTKHISKRDLLEKETKEIVTVLPMLDEKLRRYIPLRDIISVTQHTPYQRE